MHLNGTYTIVPFSGFTRPTSGSAAGCRTKLARRIMPIVDFDAMAGKCTFINYVDTCCTYQCTYICDKITL